MEEDFDELEPEQEEDFLDEKCPLCNGLLNLKSFVDPNTHQNYTEAECINCGYTESTR